jgi:hypothetical protein
MVGALDFQGAMREMERHPDSLRMKKLLWTIFYRYWENDVNRLNAVTIEYLVEGLQKYYPNLEDLATILYGLVDTLNKKAEYGRIANVIIQYLTSIYSAGHSVTRIQSPIDPVGPLVSNENKDFDELAEAITNHEQTNDMKRLLQLVCSTHQDKSPQQLDGNAIRSLIKELYHLASNLDELQYLLLDAVKSVDHRREYVWAADALSEIMWKLYGDQEEQVETSPLQLLSTPTTVQSPVPVTSNVELSTLSEITPESAKASKSVDRQEMIYTVRIDILNHTNPLRAKILLFSALYNPFTFSPQHWLELRTTNLGLMIAELLENYKDLNVLEEHLLKTAQNLRDANENTRAAQAIAQGVRRSQKP